MRSPISEFLNSYAASSAVRMHMPGHKGRGEGYLNDLTEIVGADCLFVADGIIGESERCLSDIFSSDSYYSTEGSSLSIRTALHLVTLYARSVGKRPLVLAARNVHKAFISSAILSDFDIEWLSGGEYLTSSVTPDLVEKRLSEGETPIALYLTSPDYLGGIVDIAGISEVCKKYGVFLVVDNAHGAYLRFLPASRHPIDLGADIAVDSAHKTLPVLTGGGYLHLSRSLPAFFRENVKDAMALFASTSPSYLILESMDRLNPYLAGGFSADLWERIEKVSEVKSRLIGGGYTLVGDEPMKITVLAKPYGYYGFELAEWLMEKGIYVEFFDRDYLTLMPSVSTEDTELDLVADALLALAPRDAILEAAPLIPAPVRVTSPRAASMSPTEVLPLALCVGRVLAETSVSCPPAVPILVSGELVTEDALAAFSYYGITSLKVVK